MTFICVTRDVCRIRTANNNKVRCVHLHFSFPLSLSTSRYRYYVASSHQFFIRLFFMWQNHKHRRRQQQQQGKRRRREGDEEEERTRRDHSSLTFFHHKWWTMMLCVLFCRAVIEQRFTAAQYRWTFSRCSVCIRWMSSECLFRRQFEFENMLFASPQTNHKCHLMSQCLCKCVCGAVPEFGGSVR